jgi:bifunctional DNA-binding transcriptional regulator/antitoxin component of YhaV-PrlF toxin-antitoxin module
MKKIETAMSSKYQVTIPAEVRAEMGIESPNYDIIWIKIPSGEFVLKPRKKLAKGENPFMRAFGMLAGLGEGDWVDEFIREKREEALRENL